MLYAWKLPIDSPSRSTSRALYVADALLMLLRNSARNHNLIASQVDESRATKDISDHRMSCLP